MKIIFSRKGFDSSTGGIPNPILPDGTLLSLPIPSSRDGVRYGELSYDGMSYYDIIHAIAPKRQIQASSTCHLDPDLRKGVLPREKWIPAFGQAGSSLSHLFNQGVGVGDLFLFFGWYRKTELHNGVLRFVPNAPDLHIIYGYLQVGSIIRQKEDLPEELMTHPHAADFRWETKRNALFIPTEKLSLDSSLPGYGCLNYSPKGFLLNVAASGEYGICHSSSAISIFHIIIRLVKMTDSIPQEEGRSLSVRPMIRPLNG